MVGLLVFDRLSNRPHTQPLPGSPKPLVEFLLMFRPSPALQRFGSRLSRARSSEQFINVCGQSFCKTFENGNSRILEPSLKATDVGPIDLCIDCKSFLGKALRDAKPPNISRH